MKYFSLILLLILSYLAPCASASGIRFRNINVGNGLSNNETNSIFKDSEGFVWIGTASGLNRYDGNEIRVFRHNPADSTSLLNNYVEDIFEDSAERLWVRTAGVYSVYDPASETFSRLSEKQLDEWGVEGVPNIIRSAGTDLWIATGGTGLYKVDISQEQPKAKKMITVPTPLSNFTAITPVAEQSLAIAVSDRGDLFVIEYKDGSSLRTAKVPGSGERNSSYSLMLDDTGSVWVYNFDGTFIYDINSRKWRQAPVSPEKCPVTAMTQDATGNIWIGYDNDGIEILGRDGSKEVIANNPVDIFSLANNSVRAFYTDNEAGGIWVGTYKKGVSVHYTNEFCLDTRYIADINCVYPVQNEPNWVWLGSDHEGLLKYNIETEETVHIPSNKNTAIVCLDYSPDGSLWYGTYGGGLNRFKDGKIRNYNTADGLASPNIWSVLPNSDGSMWLGTLGGGVQLFNPADMSFETFNAGNSDLNNDFINTLARSNDGRIIIGSADNIYGLSPAIHEISTERLGSLGRNHREHSAINQIFNDSRGLLWIAGRDGLECFDSRTDSLYTIRLTPNGINNIILGVIEAPDHTVWASADGALYNIVVTRSDKSIYSFSAKAYDSRDGVSTESFNQRSFGLLPSGKVVAGTQNGLAIIESAEASKSPTTARILFTGLTVNNRPVTVGEKIGGKEILPQSLNHLDKLSLGPNQNIFTVSFSTDNYRNLSRTHFRYRLKGLSTEWIECAPGISQAAFSSLAPGSYCLEVEAIGDDGLTVGGVRRLPIVVHAPWWADWWAKLIYCLLITGGCISVVYYIKRREQQRFAERQREDAQRKTDELNQLKFKFFTNISHELRTPLTLILSPTESMLKEKTDERDVRRLSTIKDNANRLLYLVNQLLDFRKNEMSELKLHLSEGDLVTTVQQACRSFIDMTDRRGQRFELITDVPSIEMEYDNDKVTKIILNLLSNAVKYTPEGGSIEVRVSRDGDMAVVDVADSGKGITDTDKKHIFERFYRSEDTSDLNTGSGIGLSMVYEYARLHKGEVTVSDNKPSGTVFRVTLPTTLVSDNKKAREDRNAAPADEKADAKRPSVLFVDDNHDLVEFLRDEFSRDYDVLTAPNGAEALRLTKEHSFDLIVSDIMMPEMDGIQLCRCLKSQPSTVNVPLILLTAKQDVGSVIEGLTLGADDYVTKPFNNEVLSLRMKRLIALGRRGLRHSLIEPSPKEIKITSVDEQLVAKAVEYVEANMGNPDLSVEEMASALGMSRVHLYKRLSALTGRTPIEFIRVLRLKRATQYLRDSRLTVAEIAYNVGFNNPKYFSKHFREEYGISPGEYQIKENRETAD